MKTLTTVLLVVVAACAFARPIAKDGKSNGFTPQPEPLKKVKIIELRDLRRNVIPTEKNPEAHPPTPNIAEDDDKVESNVLLLPPEAQGNVWQPMDVNEPTPSFLEIPWLDELLFKRIQLDTVLKASLMRSVVNKSFKKYGFRLQSPDPKTGSDLVIYDVEEEYLNESYTSTPIFDKYLNMDDDDFKEDNDMEVFTNEHGEIDPRKTRQSVSKTKALVTQDLDNLRNGLNKNIKPKPNVFYPSTPDPEKALHGIILITVFAASSTIVVGALVYGWYIFIRQGPPSVDVEYPNYGVTGPTADAPGDRRLARSAQMYHYQHQKQQIIAMEQRPFDNRFNEGEGPGQILSAEKLMPNLNGMETRDGSVSDPDSEEENAEGEYTVYECPGLATTGEMEVKNPMFKEDPAPATPGTCELVHPQPKE